MIIAAPFTAGTSAVWGADLIVGAVTGKSMFDHAIHWSMTSANLVRAGTFSENYLANFSLWHTFGDVGLNLLASEAIALCISAGLSAGAGWLGGKLGFRAGSSLTASTMDDARNLLLRQRARTGLLGRLIGPRWAHRVLRFTSKSVAFKLLKEYFELNAEVIFEMAFDGAMNLNEGEQPLGGAETFFALMTLSILVSAAMGAHQLDVGMRLSDDTARLIRRLQLVAIALAIATDVVKLPVMVAYMT